MALVLKNFLLQDFHDLLVVPIVLVEDLSVRKVLDILHLVKNAFVLENCIEGLRLDADFENFLSV